MPVEKPGEVVAGVLTAPIAVEQQRAWGGTPLLPGHLQCIDDQAALHMRLQAPAHHAPAEQVDDDGQKQPALVGGEWSKRQGVVELFPRLSSPNRTCTSQRIRLSVQVLLIAKATSA